MLVTDALISLQVYPRFQQTAEIIRIHGEIQRVILAK